MALLMAASLVLLHHNPKYSGLVSRTAADSCAQVLDAQSAQTRLFLRIVRRDWFRLIAKLIERITIPGILLHYVLRKKCIAGLVRSALINGATQVVIIGAGFDPLSFELHQEFPGVQFWEIDHPATQRHKVRTFSKIDAERLHFVAMDLSATTFDSPYACTIFNFFTFHTPQGIEASACSFRGLIDLAIACGGSYYLTYHKFAKPEQVLACYPQFKQFLNLKRKYDPAERFQSDRYRHYRKLFTS
jgi:Leucine carboxyl methyltransferase